MAERELQSAITLFLTGVPELEAAHWELYPERVEEGIPLSITLLYPFVPAAALDAATLAEVESFCASRPPLEFELVRLDEIPDAVVYAVPEPDEELRATMRALWARFPETPPYGRAGSDPPPHASLGRFAADPDPGTLRQRAEERVGTLLPVGVVVREATLMEEHAPDRWRVRATFPFGGSGPGRG